MQRNGEDAIAIIGAGVVGGALLAYLRGCGRDVRVFDPPKGHNCIDVLDDAQIVFICVPTPYEQGRGFDDRYVLEAVARVPGSKTVVLKSTVVPGMTDALQERYPQHRILFNPEFLREATAYDDFVHPDRQIIGASPENAAEAARIMPLLPRAPFERICAPREAEMAKYVANSFLAIKVSYANECFDLCERLGIDYAGVRDIVAADGRIGGSHLDVLDGGYRGYGGKCLPKDSKSLLDLARGAGALMDVLRAADRTNTRMRAPAKPGPERIEREPWDEGRKEQAA